MAADTASSEDDEIADTYSLTASVTDYPVHWGRRYHKYKEGSYLYPNDETEANRLDYQYAIIKAVHGDRLFFAPVPSSARRILDVGTGTGIWPLELAETGAFPNANIIGTDLSPIQPKEVPENVFFETHDCSEREWNRPANSVDFIHTRMMLGSLESFPQFLRTARRYLRPGAGWLECQEIETAPMCDDGTMSENWPFQQWEKAMDRGSRRAGRQFRIAGRLKPWMEQNGFVDVQEHIFRIPVGSWPKNKELKKIGRAWAEMLTGGLPALSYKCLGQDGLGWTREEIEVDLASVRKAIADRNVHAYHRFYVVFGRRPSAQEEQSMPPPPRPAGRGMDDLTRLRAAAGRM